MPKFYEVSHSRHGKHIMELKTGRSIYEQVEYPAWMIMGGRDLNRANFSVGHFYITKPFNMGGDTHSHDFDQVLFFLGGDPKNTEDFDAEIEIFLEEKYELITRASCVHIPAGTKHCPLIVKKVNKPFIFMDVTLAPMGSNRPPSKQASPQE